MGCVSTRGAAGSDYIVQPSRHTSVALEVARSLWSLFFRVFCGILAVCSFEIRLRALVQHPSRQFLRCAFIHFAKYLRSATVRGRVRSSGIYLDAVVPHPISSPAGGHMEVPIPPLLYPPCSLLLVCTRSTIPKCCKISSTLLLFVCI